MNARETLDAKLALIARAVEDARAYEHEHGLARHDTRKHAGNALRTLRHWRVTVNAERRSTLPSKAVAIAPQAGSRAGE
jgi:hypothetical protein